MSKAQDNVTTLPPSGSTGAAIKINIGCGGSWHADGWLGIDQRETSGIWQPSDEPQFLDLDVKRGLPFPTNSVDVVFSSHTLEHFTYEEAIALLFEIYRVLKVGAPLCLVVPDMDFYLRSYTERNTELLNIPEIIGGHPKTNLADNFLMNFYSDPKFNNTCHKYAYNFENLSDTLQLVGFDEIERVGFHEFSYWPELEASEFRSLIPHIQRFSLSVQCRKTSYNSQYRERPEYREAVRYSRFRENEARLAQHLNSALILNEGLSAQLNSRTAENERLKAENEQLQERVRSLTGNVSETRERIEIERIQKALADAQVTALRAQAERDQHLDVSSRLKIELDQQSRAFKIREQEFLETNDILYRELQEIRNRYNAVRSRFERLRKMLRSNRRPPAQSADSVKVWEQSYLSSVCRMISESGLFDRNWYLSTNPDLTPDIDPVQHYVEFAAAEGRDPHPLFNSSWYLSHHSDVARDGVNPLYHYITVGAAEGRDPHPLFDTRWYLSKVSQPEACANPLIHYLKSQGPEHPDPNFLFDREWYRTTNSDLANFNGNLFTHFVEFGDWEGRSPCPFFDSIWYSTQYLDVNESGLLEHYQLFGAHEGRSPNPYFDSGWYIANYPDVAAASMSPLEHYIRHGAAENRDPGPRFSTAAYKAYYKDVAESGMNPLEHFLRFGLAERRDPKPTIELPCGESPMKRILEKSATPEIKNGEIAPARYSPLISVLMPTFNTPVRFLKEVVQSIVRQSYQEWELCIVDDGSTDKDCLRTLEEIAHLDGRIRVFFSPQNEGIAHSSQRALEMATGEFIAFVDHDDALAPNALTEVVAYLRQQPMTDMVYTDHAMMDENSVLLSGQLKPNWSPDFFLSTNYIVHFKVIRHSLLNQVGAFKDTISVAQDIGLSCKLAGCDARICHLPKVLYYWRTHSGSVARGTSAKPAIQRAALDTYNQWLERRGINATLVWPDFFRERRIGAYKLNFPSSTQGGVALIIPAINRSCDISALEEDLKKTDFQPLRELHLVTNDRTLTAPPHSSFRVHFVSRQEEFNEVISGIDCELLVFLSPTGLKISSVWLKELIGYLSLSAKIGAVGGKVLDMNLNVQAGGYLLLNHVFTICGGNCDESDGHWFNGRIASNVEAVSSRLLATPKSVYLEAGGIPYFQFGDAAGVVYSLRLKAANYRVVYNPWSKIVDQESEKLPADLMAKLKQEFRPDLLQDRYYHPFFSRDLPYVLT